MFSRTTKDSQKLIRFVVLRQRWRGILNPITASVHSQYEDVFGINRGNSISAPSIVLVVFFIGV
jgi:hypothetical protein